MNWNKQTQEAFMNWLNNRPQIFNNLNDAFKKFNENTQLNKSDIWQESMKLCEDSFKTLSADQRKSFKDFCSTYYNQSNLMKDSKASLEQLESLCLNYMDLKDKFFQSCQSTGEKILETQMEWLNKCNPYNSEYKSNTSPNKSTKTQNPKQ